MTYDVKEILLSLGYSNISEDSKNFRMKPIYRESGSVGALSVRKDTGYFIDFGRNLKGNIFQLIKLSKGLETVEKAQHWLSNKSFVEVKREEAKRPTIKQSKIFDRDCLLKLKKDHAYWMSRGVKEETIAMFGGGVMDAGKMKDRYVFPIFNFQKDLIGVSGRYVHELPSESRKPKWKHIGDTAEWKYPLQFNNKIVRRESSAILVESIGDMLSLWDEDVKNTIVTFGLNINPAIVSYLLRVDVDNIYIAFNNDEGKNSAGHIAAGKAVNKLSRYFDDDQIHVAIPDKKMCDFGDMNPEEIYSWKKKYYLHQD